MSQPSSFKYLVATVNERQVPTLHAGCWTSCLEAEAELFTSGKFSKELQAHGHLAVNDAVAVRAETLKIGQASNVILRHIGHPNLRVVDFDHRIAMRPQQLRRHHSAALACKMA